MIKNNTIFTFRLKPIGILIFFVTLVASLLLAINDIHLYLGTLANGLILQIYTFVTIFFISFFLLLIFTRKKAKCREFIEVNQFVSPYFSFNAQSFGVSFIKGFIAGLSGEDKHQK